MRTLRSAGVSGSQALNAGVLAGLWILMAAAAVVLLARIPGSPTPAQLVAPADGPFHVPVALPGTGLGSLFLTLAVLLLACILTALVCSMPYDDPGSLPGPVLVVTGVLTAIVVLTVLVGFPYRATQLRAAAPTTEELFVDWAAERYGADLSALEEHELDELLGGPFAPSGLVTVLAESGESYATYTNDQGTVLVDPGKVQELPRAT